MLECLQVIYQVRPSQLSPTQRPPKGEELPSLWEGLGEGHNELGRVENSNVELSRAIF